MAPATALLDELAEEILLRFPADDPACLVADPGFRLQALAPPRRGPRLPPPVPRVPRRAPRARRLRQHHQRLQHRRPPQHRRRRPRHIRLRRPRPALRRRPLRPHLLLPCRRQLARPWTWRSDDRFFVWDPVTGEKRELPAIPGSPFEIKDPFSWNAAVLCAAAGCNHLDCHRKPFAVVFVTIIRTVMLDCAYSSEAGRWSEPAAHCAQQTDGRLKLEPSALVGNALYFMLQSRTKILKYSSSSRETGVIHLPIVCSSERHIVLMAIEDGGGLGFATVRDSKLCLWSMEVGSDGDAGWAQRGVIDLKKLLPDSAFSSPLPDVVGFADGIGVIFLQTNDGVVTIDLKSSRVMRVPKISGGSSIFPYMSFYSPALGAPAASTGGDETGTSASSVSKA